MDGWDGWMDGLKVEIGLVGGWTDRQMGRMNRMVDGAFR